MEPKQELSSIDLRALVAELSRYEGAVVDKAYLYDADLVRLKLRDFDRGRIELLVQLGDIKRVHVADVDHVDDAPGRPPDFAKMLRNRIAGANLVDVSQYEFDRILVFEFERTDQNTTLVAELFGEGNLAVLDETGEVVDSLSTVRLRSRTVAPGAPYEYPSTRLNPLEVGFDAFRDRMDESEADIVRTLATQLNLGGLYAEEVCSRAGIDKETPVGDADDALFQAVHDGLDRIATDLKSGTLDPRVYSEDETVVDVAPFPLAEREERGLSAESYESFNDAVDDYFHHLELDADTGEQSDTGPDFEAEIATQKRIIQQQKGAIEGFETQAEEEQTRAELLYANYDLVDEVLSTVQTARAEGIPWEQIEETLAAGAEQGISAAEAVHDIDAANGTVTIDIDQMSIPLDASMGVEKNADQRYKEAKRIKAKKEGALEAIENTRDELADLQQRRDEYDQDGEHDGPGDDESQTPDDATQSAPDWVNRSSVPIRTSDPWYDRFRWFHTSDEFLVIGGRNADQNEELVKKYMDSNDLFFHSQAHGGPVTVLKAAGPSEAARGVEIPDRSRAEAAQFAVSYSSVWKDGRFAGDAYEVTPDQVSKTPESGEYIEKGGFVIRGDRTYHRSVSAEVAVGIQCEPLTRVIGGPSGTIREKAATTIQLRPGKYAQNDAAKRCYREFRSRFTDESLVRKVASPDKIAEFLPGGGSEMTAE